MKKYIVSLFTLTLFAVNAMAQCDVPSTVTATVRLVRKPNTLLHGQFSVASGVKVSFSQGNLQYKAGDGSASSPEWRFAANQWDRIGAAAGNTTESNRNVQANWIDLFGYGTSGNDSKYPYQASTTVGDYASGDIAGTNYDWGKKIFTEGVDVGYRVLTSAEWAYILNSRGANLHFLATVHSVPGLVLLPDGWSSIGVSYTVTVTSYTTNNISDADWTLLENAGAVFLPAAGQRSGTTVSSVGSNGYYWSSTGAKCTDFSTSGVSATTTTLNNYIGASVRLVQTL